MDSTGMNVTITYPTTTTTNQCPSCGRCKECGQPWPVFQPPVQPIYIPVPAGVPNTGSPVPAYPQTWVH